MSENEIYENRDKNFKIEQLHFEIKSSLFCCENLLMVYLIGNSMFFLFKIF